MSEYKNYKRFIVIDFLGTEEDQLEILKTVYANYGDNSIIMNIDGEFDKIKDYKIKNEKIANLIVNTFSEIENYVYLNLNRSLSKKDYVFFAEILKRNNNRNKTKLKLEVKQFYKPLYSLLKEKGFEWVSKKVSGICSFPEKIKNIMDIKNDFSFTIKYAVSEKIIEKQGNLFIDEVLNLLNEIDKGNIIRYEGNEDNGGDNENLFSYLKERFFKNSDLPYFYYMLGFPQISVNHVETLNTHVALMIHICILDYYRGFMNRKELLFFILLSFFHDIGKLFTKRVKYIQEKDSSIYEYFNKNYKFRNSELDKFYFVDLEDKTKIIESFKYTFYNHPDVSYHIFKYEFKDIITDRLEKEGLLDQESIALMGLIIYSHINTHQFVKEITNKNKKKHKKIDLGLFNVNTEYFQIEIIDGEEDYFNIKYDIEKIEENYGNIGLKYIPMAIKFENIDSSGRITFKDFIEQSIGMELSADDIFKNVFNETQEDNYKDDNG